MGKTRWYSTIPNRLYLGKKIKYTYNKAKRNRELIYAVTIT